MVGVLLHNTQALKKHFKIILLLLFCILTPAMDKISAVITVHDRVGVNNNPAEGSVILLDMTGKDRTWLGIYGRNFATGPGAPVQSGGGAGSVEVGGGYLKYTLWNKEGTYKITVHTTETSENYNQGTLSVKISAVTAGGSQPGSLLGIIKQEYVPIKAGVQEDLITGISGQNTWTGTERRDGARVMYRLNGDPGNISGSKLPVIYTIIQES